MCKTRWEHYLLSESNWKLYPFHLTQPQDHHFRQLLKKVESYDEHYKNLHNITVELGNLSTTPLLRFCFMLFTCWDYQKVPSELRISNQAFCVITKPNSCRQTKTRNHQWHGQLERSAGITNSQWHRTEANACLCQKARENWRVW